MTYSHRGAEQRRRGDVAKETGWKVLSMDEMRNDESLPLTDKHTCATCDRASLPHLLKDAYTELLGNKRAGKGFAANTRLTHLHCGSHSDISSMLAASLASCISLEMVAVSESSPTHTHKHAHGRTHPPTHTHSHY